MRTTQYYYLNGVSENGTIEFEAPDGTHITHIGIQVPFRPFMVWRAYEIMKENESIAQSNENTSDDSSNEDAPIEEEPSISIDENSDKDVIINDEPYVINPNGILEFDDIYLEEITISFPLFFDSMMDKDHAVLREIIVEIGVSPDD